MGSLAVGLRIRANDLFPWFLDGVMPDAVSVCGISCARRMRQSTRACLRLNVNGGWPFPAKQRISNARPRRAR
ncbi:TPA: hypothetical protein HH295_15120 [Xanthomonas vasicola pv. zeae]|uniref:hypothetical protein n=1 Tax=Xanthomonas vasicola TaxID=56459 RepID=UPI0001CBFB14|nr:hypothetical protein [Xanthomonas vasicola]AZR28087.1 hypothetical protein NX80_018290 [Xanthomonas vasicola pv. arecae]AZR29692.1 hypothetical protein KWO_003170 [Xanthomonas vasicola pv. musacearum NCPPB 4379]AZR33619.1 hypothetical protein NX08_003055 [Xanthomonas vasicola]MBV6743269.1 hypothetical protein [Xanthomonas vasicola pv. musacearum NCPPB 2251]MBV6746675.1 hypothetical protein [Xanthomonas vasicola pv. vasculorum NCPPB 890]